MSRAKYAFRRSLEFLSSGNLHLKDSVKAISFSYDTRCDSSSGVRRFLAEQLPPIQYKNPNVQFMMNRNAVSSPIIKVYFGDGKQVNLDVDGKAAPRILRELSSIAGKLDAQVRRAEKAAECNMANFGDARQGRRCICEVPGQVPCPSVVPIQNVQHAWHQKKEQTN